MKLRWATVGVVACVAMVSLAVAPERALPLPRIGMPSPPSRAAGPSSPV